MNHQAPLCAHRHLLQRARQFEALGAYLALNEEASLAQARAADAREVILALNATVEGQTTAHYIADALEGMEISVTSLAQGVPIGGELDYLDDGTIQAAMRARKAF